MLAQADGPFLADPTWPDRLIGTLDLLREHILKEQDGVFPAAPANLSVEQWEAVEAVRVRVSTRPSDPRYCGCTVLLAQMGAPSER